MNRDPGETSRFRSWSWIVAEAAIVILALGIRASCFLTWEEPANIHYMDESLLLYEPLAMWEGVTPREVGWPASTTRSVLALGYAFTMLGSGGISLERDGHSPVAILGAVARWSGARLDDPGRCERFRP